MVARLTLILCLLAALAACWGTAPESPAQTTPSASIPAASPAATETTPPAPTRLVLWLPASLSPDRSTPAGAVLADRLARFEETHPGLSLQIRPKAESGPAGLLESLIATAAAAPAALPDAILLDPAGLSTAALKGLILPLGDRVAAPSEPEWYAFAVEASRVDGVVFGLPVGADAQVLAYRTDAFSSPPLAWSDLLDVQLPFLFPAADTSGSFTLAQLLAQQARLYDDAGRPVVDQPKWVDVFDFYQAARSAGVLPLSARQYASVAETWRVFKEGRALAAEAHLRPFLLEGNPAIHAATALPTASGSGISLVWCWSWALTAREPESQQAALELFQWLIDPEFLASWTLAAGLLPTTPTALQRWPAGSPASLASRLVTAALPAPSAETTGIFGPPLQQAVQAVLSGQASPEEAAQAAAQALENP